MALLVPAEVWLDIFGHLSFTDLQTGVKPVSRKFYRLAKSFRMHGLTVETWTKVFEHLTYGDLKSKVQLVCKDFKHLIDNAQSPELRRQLFYAKPNEGPPKTSTKVQCHRVFQGESIAQQTRNIFGWNVVYPWPQTSMVLSKLPLAHENATNPPATRVIVQIDEFKPIIISHRRQKKNPRAVTVLEVVDAVTEIMKTIPPKSKMLSFLTRVGCRGCCFDKFWEEMLGHEIALVMRACDWEWFNNVQSHEDGTVLLKIDDMVYHSAAVYDFW